MGLEDIQVSSSFSENNLITMTRVIFVSIIFSLINSLSAQEIEFEYYYPDVSSLTEIFFDEDQIIALFESIDNNNILILNTSSETLSFRNIENCVGITNMSSNEFLAIDTSGSIFKINKNDFTIDSISTYSKSFNPFDQYSFSFYDSILVLNILKEISESGSIERKHTTIAKNIFSNEKYIFEENSSSFNKLLIDNNKHLIHFSNQEKEISIFNSAFHKIDSIQINSANEIENFFEINNNYYLSSIYNSFTFLNSVNKLSQILVDSFMNDFKLSNIQIKEDSTFITIFENSMIREYDQNWSLEKSYMLKNNVLINSNSNYTDNNQITVAGNIRWLLDDASFWQLFIWKIDLDQINSIVESKTLNNLNLYPNPFDDWIFINTEFKFENIHIYDLNGNKVNSNLVSGEKINLSYLPKGIYFCVVGNEKESKTIKIIRR